MAQLGNTGINGNLMVVGKIVTNNINAVTSTLSGELNMNGQSIIDCNNINVATINSKRALTGSYSNGILTLTEI